MFLQPAVRRKLNLIENKNNKHCATKLLLCVCYRKLGWREAKLATVIFHSVDNICINFYSNHFCYFILVLQIIFWHFFHFLQIMLLILLY